MAALRFGRLVQTQNAGNLIYRNLRFSPLGAVLAPQQFRFDSFPVVSKVFWQCLCWHAVHTCRALVAYHCMVGIDKVLPVHYPTHQIEFLSHKKSFRLPFPGSFAIRASAIRLPGSTENPAAKCLFGGGALVAKIADLGFSGSHFFASSVRTGRKNGKVRFLKLQFAA